MKFMVNSRNAVFEILRKTSSNLDSEMLGLQTADFCREKDFSKALVRFFKILNSVFSKL